MTTKSLYYQGWAGHWPYQDKSHWVAASVGIRPDDIAHIAYVFRHWTDWPITTKFPWPVLADEIMAGDHQQNPLNYPATAKLLPNSECTQWHATLTVLSLVFSRTRQVSKQKTDAGARGRAHVYVAHMNVRAIQTNNILCLSAAWAPDALSSSADNPIPQICN